MRFWNSCCFRYVSQILLSWGFVSVLSHCLVQKTAQDRNSELYCCWSLWLHQTLAVDEVISGSLSAIGLDDSTVTTSYWYCCLSVCMQQVKTWLANRGKSSLWRNKWSLREGWWMSVVSSTLERSPQRPNVSPPYCSPQEWKSVNDNKYLNNNYFSSINPTIILFGQSINLMNYLSIILKHIFLYLLINNLSTVNIKNFPY